VVKRPEHVAPAFSVQIPTYNGTSRSIQRASYHAISDFLGRLGGEWKPVAVDRELPDSAMKWRRAGGGAVALRRVLNGASGPSWLVTPFHVLVAHPTCMLRRGETGAIWRLYDSPGSTGTDAGRSYDALAEVITRDSLRYHVSIQAPSAALRDSLAGEVSRAIIGST